MNLRRRVERENRAKGHIGLSYEHEMKIVQEKVSPGPIQESWTSASDQAFIFHVNPAWQQNAQGSFIHIDTFDQETESSQDHEALIRHML